MLLAGKANADPGGDVIASIVAAKTVWPLPHGAAQTPCKRRSRTSTAIAAGLLTVGSHFAPETTPPAAGLSAASNPSAWMPGDAEFEQAEELHRRDPPRDHRAQARATCA
jgi:hypothetical protein